MMSAIAPTGPFSNASTRRESAPRVPASGVALLVSLAVVVAAFATSSIYVDFRMREDTERSAHVATNSLPSVVHLAELRTALHDVDEVADSAVADPEEGLKGLERLRAEVRASLDAYLALPSSPWERALQAPLRKELDEFLSSTDALADALSEGDKTPSAHLDGARATVRRSAAEGDVAIRELIELNAVEGREMVSRLDADRRSVGFVSLSLAAASCLVSIILGLVAFRTMRRYTALVERRAEELEGFASRVAHDIRGPLSPALGALEMARQAAAKDVPLARVLDRGVRSVHLVDSIIDGLLTFARSGAAPEPGVSVNLRSAAEEVFLECQVFAEERNVKLVLSELPDAEVACAPGVLLSVLSNLLRNAIRYGPALGGLVRFRAELGHDCVRCEVIDNGPGIPEAQRQAIFLPNVRLDRRPGGLGLGLATVERLVRAHGGTLGVTCAPNGTGALFWFELPRCEERA